MLKKFAPGHLHILSYTEEYFFSDSCTPVHEILIFFPLFLCVAQGVAVEVARRNFFFGNFFQLVKILLNFWNFVNIKVAKSKLDHLGFYCKLDFFDRTIRKIRNWNRNWVLIDGTPCICTACSREIIVTYSIYSKLKKFTEIQTCVSTCPSLTTKNVWRLRRTIFLGQTAHRLNMFFFFVFWNAACCKHFHLFE